MSIQPSQAAAILDLLDLACDTGGVETRVSRVLARVGDLVPYSSAMWLWISPMLEMQAGVQAGCTAEDVALYLDHFAATDPFIRLAPVARHLNEPLRLRDVTGSTAPPVRGVGRFGLWVRHRHALGTFVGDRGHPLAFLRMHRTAELGDFSPGQVEVMRRLSPHLARALRPDRLPEQDSSPRLPGVLVYAPDGTLLFQTGIAGKPLLPAEAHRVIGVASTRREGILALGGVPYRFKVVPLARTSILACFAPSAAAPATGIGTDREAAAGNRMVFLSVATTRRDLRERMRRMGCSEREIEVGLMIVRGESNKEIAGRLGIRPQTVKEHTSAIYRKSGYDTRARFVSGLLGLDGEMQG